MGVCLFDPIWARKTHTTRSAELLHIIAGHVDLRIGRQRFFGGPGDTLLVPSSTAHRDEFDLDLGLQVFMVHFSWEAEEEFLRLVDNRLLRDLPTPVKAELGKVFERMRTDIRGDSEADGIVIRSRLMVALSLMLREARHLHKGARSSGAEEYGKRHRRQLMFRAKAYLEDHYCELVSLQDIADALRVSPFYLSHVFSEESDFSLFAYLTLLRLEKAKSLLAQGKLNVSEIASLVGYENSNYFSKVFKRHFGRPPRAFLCSPPAPRKRQ